LRRVQRSFEKIKVVYGLSSINCDILYVTKYRKAQGRWNKSHRPFLFMKTDNRFYKSKQWELVRDAVLRRDGYSCQLCKRYGRMVGARHVHHIYPFEDYPEYALKRWNLISLCQQCHNRMHDRDTHQLTEEGKRLKRKVWKNTRADGQSNRDGMTY